jgi:hypothetical protein
MSVVEFRSTDAGAPVINGTAGNGVPNLFDICLVGSGTAYGSKPKLGWTKVFSGTDKGVYRTVDGNCYLRVQQDGGGAGGYREALVRAAEGATNVDTLVDQFPSLSDVAAGSETWRTSDTLNTTARAWVLIASENWLVLNVMFGASANINDEYRFGKYHPLDSGNAWPYLITVRNSSNSGIQSQAASCAVPAATQFSGATRLFAMRTPDGTVKAPRASFVTGSATSVGGGLPGIVGPAIPDGAGRIVLAAPQLWINGVAGTTASNQAPAGVMPNLWSPLHNCGAAGSAPFGDTFGISTYDPDARFELMGGALSAAGKWVVETTDTWQVPPL